MAKKYQAIPTKVHWATYTIIASLILLITVLILALRPSAKESFYNSYLERTTEANFQKKLPSSNNFILLNGVEDSWLGIKKGMFSVGKSDKVVSIIFIGNLDDESSVATIDDVYARLYGSLETDPIILKSDLAEKQVKLYYLGLNEHNSEKVLSRINGYYKDDEINLTNTPVVLALYDNHVVKHLKLSGSSNPALSMKNFYDDLLTNEDLEDFFK